MNSGKIYFAVILLSIINLVALVHIFANSLIEYHLFSLDLIQIQLIGRAIRDNIDPYSPFQVLSAKYLGIANPSNGSVPLPYPPTIFPLALLLSFVSPRICYLMWTLVSIGCLWFGMQSFIRVVNRKDLSMTWRLMIFNLLLVSNAAQTNLNWGNFSIILFFLVACSI